MSKERVRLPDPAVLAEELRELKALAIVLHRAVAQLTGRIAELESHTASLEERFTRHQERHER